MTDNEKETKSSSKPAAGSRRGGPMGGGPAVEKAKNFRRTIFRLLSSLFDSKRNITRMVVMIILLFASASFSAMAPKQLGNATTTLFEGLISQKVTATFEEKLPQGTSLDSFKQMVNNEDGTLNVEKLREMTKRMADAQTATQNSNSVTSSESQSGVNLDSQMDMLNSMSIRIGEGVDFNKFAWLILVVVFIYLLSFFSRCIAGWISVRLIAQASQKLRQQIEEKLWKLPLSYFDKTSRGEVMSKTTNDLDNVTQTLNQTGGDLIYMILMVASVVFMMFTVSPLLAIIALATIPVSFAVIAVIMKKSQPQFKKQWATTGELNGHIEEAFSGHTLIKAYGQAEKFEDKFNENNEKLYSAGFKAQFISGIIMPVMTFMTNVNYVIVALVGASKVINGSMSLGDVQAFIQYSRQYSQPLGQISQMVNLLQSGAASAERIFELIDAEEESNESELPQKLEKVNGLLEFKNVDFSYDPNLKLIENMNLVAKPGQTVAIVGPTGAGKTTLVNLILRFYDIQSGSIELDGINTSEISRHALRLNISMVLQDTWLFKGTIEENLKYGVPEGKTISDEEFLAATKSTYVDHFVKALPKGYQTVLSDDDSAISVGEKQLLTIARAFLANPDILILDEATSSVDTRTEVLVQKAMNKLRSGRTSFVIAHRLSTIRDADVIVVMEKGTIVEQGTHDSLIRSGGRYAALYQSQFDDADEYEE